MKAAKLEFPILKHFELWQAGEEASRLRVVAKTMAMAFIEMTCARKQFEEACSLATAAAEKIVPVCDESSVARDKVFYAINRFSESVATDDEDGKEHVLDALRYLLEAADCLIRAEREEVKS